MYARADTHDQEEFDKLFVVFDGSCPEDVSHARRLWSSLSLLPPLESRLVSADIRQRLPVSRPQRGGPAAASTPKAAAADPLSGPALRQAREERQRYAAMGDQRREILALLRRQREQRIQKELVSESCQPPAKLSGGKVTKAQEAADSDSDLDRELVQQLQ